MRAQSTTQQTLRKKRLMRHGFAVTGVGLFGLLTAAALLIEGAAAILTLSVLAFAGLSITVLGFGMMVVAADPFADCEVDSYSDAGTAEHPRPQD